MSEVHTDTAAGGAKPARKLRRWIWWAGGGAALLGLLIAAVCWLTLSNKIWTDGGAIRVADRDTKVRQVIWTRPYPLQGFSSDEQVYEPSISPDGTELYFVRGKAGGHARIYLSHRHNNSWSKPAPVDAVNGPFDSLGPRLTPDGNFLLFYSDRPGGLGGYDIWASPRTGSGWGKPFNLGPSVNSEFNEFNPDPTTDGKHLIFATNRKAARREQHEAWRSTIRETVSSDYDLWIADTDLSAVPIEIPATQPSTEPTTRPSDESPEAPPPHVLAFRAAREIPGVNTSFSEGASCMSPAGDFLYFASNRPGGMGKFDVYRCRVHGDQFDPVENVGPSINSAENESDPSLAYGGFRMVFSSDRPGADGRYHLLVSDSREVYPEHLGHPLPQLGWSWWLLILSVLVLVPLLMFLRGWDDNRLGLLQKCLLLSLLVHALLTFILSFVAVTQKITQYVRHEIEVTVNLSSAEGANESLAIRSQSGGGADLPVSAPAAANLQRAVAPAPQIPAAQMLPPDTPPGAKVQPSEIVLAVQAPKNPSTPAGQSIQPQANAPSAELPDVKLPDLHPVSQSEAVASAQAAVLTIARATGQQTPSEAPTVQAPVAAPMPPSAKSLTDAAPSSFSSAKVNSAVASAAAPVDAAAAGETLNVNVGGSGTAKLSGSEPAVGPTGHGAGALARAASDLTGGPAPVREGVGRAPPAMPAASDSLSLSSASGSRGAIPAVQQSAPQPSQAASETGTGPQVHIAGGNARQSAPEPPVMATAGGGSIARPLQGAASGSETARATQMDLPGGDPAAKASASDLPVASFPQRATGIRNDAGSASAARAPIAAAVAAPQISGLSSGSSGSSRVAAREPALDASGTGPATRPTELASSAEGQSRAAPSLELGGAPTVGPGSTEHVGPAPAPSTGKALASAMAGSSAAQPRVQVADAPADGVGALGQHAAQKIGENSGSQQAAASASPVAPARQDAGGGLASAAPRSVSIGNLPTAATTGKSALSSPAPAAYRAGHSVPNLAGASSADASGQIASPQLSGPKMAMTSGKIAGGNEPADALSPTAGAGVKLTNPSSSSAEPAGIDLAAAPVQARLKTSGSLKGAGPLELGPRGVQLAATVISPQVDLQPLGPLHGAPDTPFMRAPEQRKPLLEKFGGTRESEDAVDRGLAYLARMQEADGRWTRVDDDRVEGQRPPGNHDMACTGFAILAFLAHDNTPDKPGPYRQTVARAVDYLISQQDDDGDVRGLPQFRGPGPDAANMYDQGIATYALAECAIMTRDPKTVAAAIKGARFIVLAQDRQSGGWRYSPNEYGDSSVFGWQIMALHSAQQVGFEVPQETIEGARRYIESCAEGREHLLGGYQPHNGPTPAMTAELLFCRMLLDMPLDDDGIDEATRFLARDPPEVHNANFYYWYYASLSMLHMQDRLWKDWNILTRESLIRMQRRNGSWGEDRQWGARGGRIFTTAIATLTLEVYYRYLPLRKAPQSQPQPQEAPSP